jgi:hypothetical protein
MLAAAECNERTLSKWLVGRPMQPSTKERLDKAARALGFFKFRGDRPRDKRVSRG